MGHARRRVCGVVDAACTAWRSCGMFWVVCGCGPLHAHAQHMWMCVQPPVHLGPCLCMQLVSNCAHCMLCSQLCLTTDCHALLTWGCTSVKKTPTSSSTSPTASVANIGPNARTHLSIVLKVASTQRSHRAEHIDSAGEGPSLRCHILCGGKTCELLGGALHAAGGCSALQSATTPTAAPSLPDSLNTYHGSSAPFHLCLPPRRPRHAHSAVVVV